MNPDDLDRASAEIERLQTRVRRLAEEKAYLQLTVRLIEQLNPRPGLQEMVSGMILGIMEAIGGTDIKIWYWIEEEVYYASLLSGDGIATGIDDPVAAQVVRERDFAEVPGDPTKALLRDSVLPGSRTWCFPLRVGQELIGVIKLENIPNSGDSLRNYLPIFFGHAALLLSNEIRSHLRQKAQAALRAKTEELDSYFNSALDLFCIADTDGYFRKLNAAWREALGYEIADLEGKRFLDLVHPDDMAATLAAIRMLAERNAVVNFVNRYRHKDGSWRWIEWCSQPQEDLIFAAARDITDRKRTEEALERARNMLVEAQKIAHLGSFEYVAATRTTAWSEEEYRIYGLDPAGPSPAYDAMLAQCIHPDDAALLHETFTQAMQSKSIYELEHRIVRPDGGVRWVYDRAHPHFDEKGGLVRYVGATLDITERKRAEETLRAALAEKTVLLKEIHHRVKNNLQIVDSLLNLQIDRLDVPEASGALRDMQSRVRSMALLHETLYRSDNLARIGLADYLEKLCAQLWRAAGPTAAGVRLERRIDAVSLSMDQAVPCGLIANELLSNALKHAFPGGRGGRVRVEARVRADRWLALAVADDGVGLPPGLDPDRADTLGLQLVAMLAAQLGGALAIAREGGAEFRVAFPLRDA